MSSQLVFTGEAGCPEFTPNRFKADMCGLCQNRIHSHSGATEAEIARALEFSVSNLPSSVWSPGQGAGQLYLGGYKAAINTTFLQTGQVRLVVNTARGLDQVLGPKYLAALERRRTECPGLQVLELLMNDDLEQELSIEDLLTVYQAVMRSLTAGDSVLVHCAQVGGEQNILTPSSDFSLQGKSRSTTVVAAILCLALKKNVEETLSLIKEKRHMAEPNINFVRQLKQLYSNGHFDL